MVFPGPDNLALLQRFASETSKFDWRTWKFGCMSCASAHLCLQTQTNHGRRLVMGVHKWFGCLLKSGSQTLVDRRHGLLGWRCWRVLLGGCACFCRHNCSSGVLLLVSKPSPSPQQLDFGLSASFCFVHLPSSLSSRLMQYV